jgi:hypothetical protein
MHHAAGCDHRGVRISWILGSCRKDRPAPPRPNTMAASTRRVGAQVEGRALARAGLAGSRWTPI